MIDFDELPEMVKNDLRDAHEGPELGDELDRVLRDELRSMTEKEVFNAWLEFNGIVGLTNTISRALDGIRSAQT